MSSINGINLTERQKELLVEFAKSEHFKILKDVVIPQRQVQIAKQAINFTGDSLQPVHQMQGELMSWKWLNAFMKEAEKRIQSED